MSRSIICVLRLRADWYHLDQKKHKMVFHNKQYSIHSVMQIALCFVLFFFACFMQSIFSILFP